jgi:EAL and modified HD-GYP domain-containing signal transduction protein
VKLDVLDPAPDAWLPVVRRLLAASKVVVAERVETLEVAKLAAAAGCTLFQGYYFCRPFTYNARALPAHQLAYLSLFAAVSRPGLSIAELEHLVKRDVSLTLRVLRSVNSSAFGIAREITSVRHALIMIGVAQVRRWALIWALAGLSVGAVPEVMSMALLRARACEIVGEAWGGPEAACEAFLLGLCSMLDAILERPLEQVVTVLPLAPRVRDALLGGSSPLRTMLDAVQAHERGDWDASAAAASALGLGPSIVPAAYTQSLAWTREVAACAEQAA